MTRFPSSYTPSVAEAYSYLSSWAFLEWLRLLWFVSVAWVEKARYTFNASCHWNDRDLASHGTPTHVLLVSDPRVRYGPLYKSTFLNNIYNWFYELSLRKTWQAALSYNPHAVIFLGDMLASGRKVKSIEDFEAYHTRFTKTFSTSKPLPAYFVPGNEDIGLNLKPSDARRARENYIDYFGSPNNNVSIANHTLILLDAPGLVEEDYQRAESHGIQVDYDYWTPIKDGTVEFVRALEETERGDASDPRILLSHIPLARSETAYCGPLRVKGALHRGAGPGYQNMLGKQTTEFLLSTIKPVMVFSGDDRDYCQIRHTLPIDNTETFIPEITMRSFSPVDNIPSVGFHLLSLVPPLPLASDPDAPPPPPTIADAPCFLPVPLRAYTGIYLPLAVLTFFALLVHRYWRRRRQRMRGRASFLPRASGHVRAKTAAAAYWQHEDAAAPDLEYAALPPTPSSAVRMHRPRISLDRTHDTVSPQWASGKGSSAWTWTCSLGGRRRRFALRRLRLPFVDTVLAAASKRLEKLPWTRTPVVIALTDLLTIVWPAFLLWIVLTWWTMR